MMNEYKSLAVQYLSGHILVAKPVSPNPVAFDSPAIDVMTDLRQIYAAVITPGTPMEIANTYMMQRGVRTLLVMHDDNSLAGIITATDILGEKPMRFIQERGVKHNEILVMDIMTPLDMLEAIPLEEVMHARVGNIVASFRESGRLHALAIDDNTVRPEFAEFLLGANRKTIGHDNPTGQRRAQFCRNRIGIDRALMKSDRPCLKAGLSMSRHGGNADGSELFSVS